jgi:hypothetical protein
VFGSKSLKPYGKKRDGIMGQDQFPRDERDDIGEVFLRLKKTL